MYFQLYSGELRIDESLKEPMYDLSIKAVKLKKRVQMYQVIQFTKNQFILENDKSESNFFMLP